MTGSDDRTATDPNKVDAIKLSLMLADLRLPTINQLWKSFAKRADAEGWTAARFLAALAEHELAERDRRRIERHLREARLLPGKSLASFDFKAVPMLAKAQVMALAAGDGWLNQGANCLVFGPPGAGKSHLASAIGLALVENGYRVLFTRTTDLVQRLQVARRELALESQLARLDRYHLLILDDLAYVQKDQAETSVLFELISARYERRSLLITANQPFGEWNKVFPDETTAVAAVDRLVHHATILEMNVESYRTKEGAWAARQDRHREKHRRRLSARVPPRGAHARSLRPVGISIGVRTLLHASRPQSPTAISHRSVATICVCRAATINETKALAMPALAIMRPPLAPGIPDASPRPPRHNPRDERRELSPPLRARQTKEGAWAARQDRHREKHRRRLSHARVPPRRRSRSLPAARRHLNRRAALYSTPPGRNPPQRYRTDRSQAPRDNLCVSRRDNQRDEGPCNARRCPQSCARRWRQESYPD